MADLAYRNDIAPYTGRTHWGAIWAGMFAFVAIWSVFGILGEAIFATSANPAAEPVGGMSVGMGVWATILTIIAMYVGGRVTGHFVADIVDRGSRIMHGMVMFGLSVIAVIVMVILSGTALSGGTGVPGGPHSSYMLTVFSDVGWIGFVSLFLGWLAAMGGAAHGAVRTAAVDVNRGNVRDIRPAA